LQKKKGTARSDESSNQSLQPTAGRSDELRSDDFNIELRIKTRRRQQWLISFSLGLNRRPSE
jgi:hypothetical protein